MSGKERWSLFEIYACDYLNKSIGNSNVLFKRLGSSNSTANDIEVYSNSKYLFSIEAKYSPSQSGQFVIIDQKDKYEFSIGNNFENNEYSREIIRILNTNKKHYTPLGQKAVKLEIDSAVLAGWIISYYKEKDCQFIITSDELNGYKAIIPITDIQQYFNVTAVVRRKRSGTRHLPKYKFEESVNALKVHTNALGFELIEVVKENSKTLVEFKEDNMISHKSQRYFGEHNEYYLSDASAKNEYYIKVRSNTNNLNVIFSLEYIGVKDNIGLEILQNNIND